MPTHNTEETYIKLTPRAAFSFLLLGAALISAVSLLVYRGIAYAETPLENLKRNFLEIFQRPGDTPQPPGRVVVTDEETAVVNAVKRAAPAVVSISATAEVPRLVQCSRRGVPQFGIPPGFEDFFSFDMPGVCQRGTQTERVSAGTGFIVSSDGYIVTNAHVVSDDDADYTAVMNDDAHVGEQLPVRVLARDEKNDIAILKVEKIGLPHLQFGDSSKLRVGQTAIAIGYALGEFDNTVSKGVVSGLSRSVTAGGRGASPEYLRGLIQTDAAINPGNSGGPLLDLSGTVIGVNVAMANAQSIGFAVPGNAARAIYEDVKAHGKLTDASSPGFLGVRYAPVTSRLKAEKKLPYDYGVLITGGSSEEPAVVAGSPADRAGIREGDIILEADGKRLSERLLLADVVGQKKPGDTVQLKIFQSGSEKTISVTLESFR